jgi:uncharacterized sulfatase
MSAESRIDRREFVGRCAAGAAGISLTSWLAPVLHIGAQARRPNVLWIIAEDFCPELGCYGAPLVRTPHIDRLASEGTRFTGAFTTAPVCSASRSALMTGMYQTGIGAHQHRTDPRAPLPGGIGPVTDHFRGAGYFTSNCRGLNWERAGKTDLNFMAEGLFDGTDWRERQTGQPFFAQVNFPETHRAFSKDPANPIDAGQVALPPYYPDHPLARQDWADYLECAQVLDRKVGQVLDRLEEDGLADNTIVFFFGDHGRAHVRGKQFLYEGGIHVPLIVRWPGHVGGGTVSEALVSAIDLAPTSLGLAGIEPPEHMQGRPFLGPGTRTRDYIIAARDRCDETYDRIRCVRDQRYKYIRNFYPNLPYTQTNLYKLRQYPVLTLMQVLHARGELSPAQEAFMAPGRPPEELYDLDEDPHEIRNLAEDPEQQLVLESMRGLLEGWITGTGDRGEIPEDPRIAARAYRERHLPTHRRVMERRGLSLEVSPADYLEWWETQLKPTLPA